LPDPCRSASEILGGGLALSIVALIAVGGAHIARPQAPVPATPPHYATASIELSEEAARLSLSQDQLPDGAAETRNAQSSDLIPGSVSKSVEPDGGTMPPSLPIAPVSSPTVTTWSTDSAIEDAAAIRQRVTEAKSLRPPADVVRSSPLPQPRPDPRLDDTQQSQAFAAETHVAQLSIPVPDEPAAVSPPKSDRLKPLWGAPLRPPAPIPAPSVKARPAGRGIEDAAGLQQRATETGSIKRSANRAPNSPRPDLRPGPQLADARQIEDAARSRRQLIEVESARRTADAARSSSAPDLPLGPRLADTQQGHPTAPAPASARAAPTFIGDWTDDISRCEETPLVINAHAAKSASGECDFGFVAREAANRWRVGAICTSEGQFWRANIALKVVDQKLIWSSERGTEIYVRCGR
jgi:hypothetical protein